MTNMDRLAVHKMSLDAIPDGGGFIDGLYFLRDAPRLTKSAKAAKEWAVAAVLAVRQASDPNPWRESSDEEIAGEILRRVEERKPRLRKETRS